MTFDITALAEAVQRACPQAAFAILFGSAKEGVVRKGGDVDVAVFLESKFTFEDFCRLCDAIESTVPTAQPDVTIMTMETDPILRFEALKGRCLFVRDWQRYCDFFSLTCREYEDQMADYARQHRYRMEVLQQSPAHKSNYVGYAQ